MIIRIRSKQDGRIRCGIRHPRKATDHAADRFTEEELERLQGDPLLSVELIEGELLQDVSQEESTTNDTPPSGDGAKLRAATKPNATKGGKGAKPAASKPQEVKPQPTGEGNGSGNGGEGGAP
ncbi:HI1506-related protein [Metapseudomonas otitidis]|uniref:HI1506-related protein n=1 Tax=Metapseudomonas otitidis TaxID=319939 RepID=UPI0013F622A4|nr:HI1506-related protein [Pseudomonas otitidis]